MAELSKVVEFLDRELRTDEIPDFPGAWNGLQLENRSGEVSKVAAAVDASARVIEECVKRGVDLLVVHHGLFWQGDRMLTGPAFRKFQMAMDAGLAVYSSHLPLDVHPEFGNNALLARELGLKIEGGVLPWKALELGVWGNWTGDSAELVQLIEEKVGPVKTSFSTNGPVGKLAISSGGAGDKVQELASEGVETFLTGEGPHWSFPLAEELGIRVIHAGHYATETFGVRKLAELTKDRFGLESCWVDFPTGL